MEKIKKHLQSNEFKAQKILLDFAFKWFVAGILIGAGAMFVILSYV